MYIVSDTHAQPTNSPALIPKALYRYELCNPVGDPLNSAYQTPCALHKVGTGTSLVNSCSRCTQRDGTHHGACLYRLRS